MTLAFRDRVLERAYEIEGKGPMSTYWVTRAPGRQQPREESAPITR